MQPATNARRAMVTGPARGDDVDGAPALARVESARAATRTHASGRMGDEIARSTTDDVAGFGREARCDEAETRRRAKAKAKVATWLRRFRWTINATAYSCSYTCTAWSSPAEAKTAAEPGRHATARTAAP